MNNKKTISKTKAVELINLTKGRFFTVTFITKDNRMRTMNCNKKANSTTALGYIRVYSTADKGYRSVNPNTLKSLSYNGMNYIVK